MSLSAAQIDSYREQGYLMLPSVLDAATVAEMREVIAKLLAGARGLERHTEVYDLEDSHRP